MIDSPVIDRAALMITVTGVAWYHLGIVRADCDFLAATPSLNCVLPDLDPIPFRTWLVTHRELHTSRRIRLVFDHLADNLAQLFRINGG